jgi:hypothetical protein
MTNERSEFMHRALGKVLEGLHLLSTEEVLAVLRAAAMLHGLDVKTQANEKPE